MAVRGEIMRPAPDDTEYPLLVGERMNNPAYTEALGELNKARQKLGVKSPCEANPSLWDGIDFEEGKTSLNQELDRIFTAISGCVFCPVLSQCKALKDSQSEDYVVNGVLAADWQDNSAKGRHISHYLENGEWPEGIDPTRI